MRTLFIELRRVLSLILIPWIGATLLCIIASWYLISVVGLDALLAPVLKLWAFLKPLLLQIIKIVLAFLVWIWIHTFGKVSGWITEIVAVVIGYVGGFKAWSLKKILRQLVRFIASFAARFFLVSVLINLLFGQERKGVKQMPHMLTTRFKQSRFQRILFVWSSRSERQKRLFLGIFLCLLLVIAGHALLGLSILLFDLVWELVILLGRQLARFWKFIWPLVARFIPNALGNFFTNKVLPMCADMIPVIRHDHRVMYLRFNIRQHSRNLKAFLYRKSRSKRDGVRSRLSPYVSARVKRTKTKLLKEATQTPKKTDETE